MSAPEQHRGWASDVLASGQPPKTGLTATTEVTVNRHPTVWTLVALWALNFTTAAQFLIVAPILPRIAEVLDVDQGMLGVLITAYALTFGVTALIAGPISDHIGRRKILLVGTLGMTLALLLHGSATTFLRLLEVRAFAGLCSGLLSGASVAYISDAWPPDRRGWANGWLASALAAGQVFGIPAGTVLAGNHYATPFVAFAGLGAIALVLLLRHLPEPDVALSEELSVRSALSEYAALLSAGPTRAAVGAYVLLFTSIAMFITFLPIWLEARFAVGPTQIATMFMLGGLSNAVAGPVSGALSDKVGRKGLILVGATATALFMATTPYLLTSFWHAYVGFFLVMIFVGLRMAPQQALVANLVPARNRGTLMSLCFAIGQMVGFAAGSALSGAIYTSAWGFEGNAAIAGTLSLLMGIVVALGIPEDRTLEGSSGGGAPA